MCDSPSCFYISPGFIAIYLGAIISIGGYTLKAFLKCIYGPRVYYVGSSQKAGNRVTAECRTLATKGAFTFIEANFSLLCTTDEVCQKTKSKKKNNQPALPHSRNAYGLGPTTFFTPVVPV